MQRTTPQTTGCSRTRKKPRNREVVEVENCRMSPLPTEGDILAASQEDSGQTGVFRTVNESQPGPLVVEHNVGAPEQTVNLKDKIVPGPARLMPETHRPNSEVREARETEARA